MTFEQWIELLKVLSPMAVGFIPSFWIVRELNQLRRTQEVIVQDLKNIVNAIHDLDIRITKLEPR